jgi:hypothetical protein
MRMIRRLVNWMLRVLACPHCNVESGQKAYALVCPICAKEIDRNKWPME